MASGGGSLLASAAAEPGVAVPEPAVPGPVGLAEIEGRVRSRVLAFNTTQIYITQQCDIWIG